MGSLSARYRAGAYQDVWRDLRRVEREMPEFRRSDDCAELIRQTFSRVKQNIELVIVRLRDVGYVFECEDIGEPGRRHAEQEAQADRISSLRWQGEVTPASNSPLGRAMPDLSRHTAKILDELPPPIETSRAPLTPTAPEELSAIDQWRSHHGTFPEALEGFARHVGNLDLRQTHREPRRPKCGPVLDWLGDWDPLCFGLDCFAHKENELARIDLPDGQLGWALEFAPDAFHKASVSGGAGYKIALPTPDIDPVVIMPAQGPPAGATQSVMPFTTYLRRVIGRGGFFGTRELLIDRGHGWLGTCETVDGVYLPDHPVFSTLSEDLLAF